MTILVSDTFTDTNAVALTSHTPDTDTVGSGWVHHTGGGEILDNAAVPSTNNVRETYSIDCGQTAFKITCDCEWYDGSSVTGDYNGLCFRVENEHHQFMVGWNNSTFALVLRDGATNYVQDSVSFSVTKNVVYEIVITVDANSNITASLDGGYNLSATNTHDDTRTNVGLLSYRGRMKWDNLLVETIEAPSVSIPVLEYGYKKRRR